MDSKIIAPAIPPISGPKRLLEVEVVGTGVEVELEAEPLSINVEVVFTQETTEHASQD